MMVTFTQKQADAEYSRNIIRCIQDLRAFHPDMIELNSKDGILATIQIFSESVDMLDKAHHISNNITNEHIELLSEYRTLLIEQQVKLYPVMRRKYESVIQHAMAPYEIGVNVVGIGNHKVNFGHPDFKNTMHEFVEISLDWLTQLRYRAVGFRWGPTHNETFSDTLIVPADEDLLVWTPST